MRKLIDRVIGASRDIAGVVGAGLISFGAWQIYEPAGLIVAGAFLLIGAVLMALGAAKN